MPIYAADLSPLPGTDAWLDEGVLLSDGLSVGACGGNGAETLLSFTVPQDGYWFFTTGQGDLDSVLYLRTTCDDPASELACQDDASGTVASGVGADLVAGQTIFVFVDSYSAAIDTPYRLAAFRADGSVAPETGGMAYLTPTGNLTVHAMIGDANGDATRAYASLLDANGTAVDLDGWGTTEVDITPAATLLGLREGDAILAFRQAVVAADLAQVPTVRVRVVDLGGHETSADLAVVPQPVSDFGEACDPPGIDIACAIGLVCEVEPGAPAGACAVAVAPVLGSAGAWLSPQRDLVILSASGTDVNGDMALVRVELLAVGTDEAVDLTGAGDTTGDVSLVEGDLVGQLAFDVIGFAEGPFGIFDLSLLPPVDRARITLVDASGLESDSVVAPIGEPVLRAVGEACRAHTPIEACVVGTYCQDGVCVAGTAPVIIDSVAYRSPFDLLTVGIHFTDAEQDVIEAHVSLLPADSDEPIVLDADGATHWFTGGPFAADENGEQTIRSPVGPPSIWGVQGQTISDLPPVTRVRIELFDASGLLSDPIVVPIEDLPVAAEGEPCDHDVLIGCAEGLVCLDDWNLGTAACARLVAPVLDQLRVVDNRLGGRFGIDVQGSDDNADISEVEIGLFDGDPDQGGTPVPIPAWGGETVRVYFDVAEPDGTNFHGKLYISTHTPDEPTYVAPFTHARVSLVDGGGLVSNTLTVLVEAAAPVAEGEPCDVLEALDYCSEGLVCDGSSQICVR